MTAPGWYPDPAGSPGAYRWWDGTAWTGHVRPLAANPAALDPTAANPVSFDPAASAGSTVPATQPVPVAPGARGSYPPAPPAPAPPYQPQAPGDPYQPLPPPPPPGGLPPFAAQFGTPPPPPPAPPGRRRLPIIIGAVAVVVLLAAAGIFLATRGGDDDQATATEETESTTPETSTTDDDTTTSLDVPATPERISVGLLSYRSLGGDWLPTGSSIAEMPGALGQIHITQDDAPTEGGSFVASVLIGFLSDDIPYTGPADLEAATRALSERLVTTSGSYPETSSSEVVLAQAQDVDGHQAFVVRTELNYDIEGLNATGETVHVAVIDTGQGPQAFWGTVPDDAAPLLPEMEQAFASLTVND